MVFGMHVDADERIDQVLRLALFQGLNHDRNQLKLMGYADRFCNKVNEGSHPGLVALGL
jgi:hypothetical protein